MSLESLLAVGVIAIRRRMAIVSLLAAVSLLTTFAIIGMVPSVGWISVREALFLASVNLVAMSGYFRWLSPKRHSVSPVVTSGLAIMAAMLALFSSKAVTARGVTHTLEMVGVGGILLLTVIVWFWYDLLVLHSYSAKVDGLADAFSFSENDGNDE